MNAVKLSLITAVDAGVDGRSSPMRSILGSQRIPIGRSIISDIPTIRYGNLMPILGKETPIENHLIIGGSYIERKDSRRVICRK